jgi:hypothetical protein
MRNRQGGYEVRVAVKKMQNIQQLMRKIHNTISTKKILGTSRRRCKKENIPRPSELYNGDQWEEFCRIKITLHVPYRSFETTNTNKKNIVIIGCT